MDSAEIGYATLCHGDEAWAKTFNPNIEFSRTKTLMEGHNCCDHCYKIKPDLTKYLKKHPIK